MNLPDARPVLVIVDGSVAVTGALVSAARQAALLADELRTVLVLPRGHRVPSQRLTAFVEVIEIPIVPLRKQARSLIAYSPALVAGSLRLRRVLKRVGASRVQINDFYLLHGTILRLMGYSGRIVTFVRIDPLRFGAAGRFWLAAARRSADALVAVSRFIQQGVEDSRLVYEHAVPGAARARTSTGQLLLFVGNMIAGKGQDDAVAAFNRIARDFPAARLRFVGGDMGLAKNRVFQASVEQAAKAGPAADRIEFRGASNDLGPDYAEAFAALNFSASESFSITCLDACAAGLPVIATRCGGPEEILDDGVTGWLVPVGDVAAMADKMAWLLGHRAQAAAMGAAGQALVEERFSADDARARFRTLFDL